jgi:hypothetical protein
LLLEAKQKVPHGQWLPWLESAGIPERTAQRYLRIARNRATLEAKSDIVSDLGVTGALSLLSIRRDCPKDTTATLTANLIDLAAEAATTWLPSFEDPSEGRQRRALMEEAKRAFDEIGRLLGAKPALAGVFNTFPVEEQLIPTCSDYRAAFITEWGISAELAEKIDAAIEEGDDAQAIYKKFGHEMGDEHCYPRPASPSSLMLATRIRDMTVGWLGCLEAEGAAP